MGSWAVYGQSPSSGRDWKELERRLGSDEPGVREKAQGELAQVGVEEFEGLVRVMRETQDPDARAALEKRFGELEGWHVLKPGGMTVKVVHGSLKEVVAAINGAAGMEVIRPSEDGGGDYSVDVKGAGFWEVVEAVRKTGPMGLQVREGQWEASREEAGRVYEAVEGMGVAPRVTAWQETLKNGKVEWHLEVDVAVAADPRVHMAMFSSIFRVEQVEDEDGKDLRRFWRSSSGAMGPVVQAQEFKSGVGYQMNSAFGKRLKELKGRLEMIVMVDEAVWHCEDLEKHEGDMIGGNWGKMELTKVVRKGNRLEVDTAMTTKEGEVVGTVKEEKGGVSVRTMPLIRVVDASGRVVLSEPLVMGKKEYRPKAEVAAGALKAEVWWARRGRQLVVPVAFEGVAIEEVKDGGK